MISVYAPKNWEIFAAKFFPYYIPFLTKRQRVRIRSYFRNRWKTRLNNMLTSLLKINYANNIPKDLKWSIEDYEWEVITNTESKKINV